MSKITLENLLQSLSRKKKNQNAYYYIQNNNNTNFLEIICLHENKLVKWCHELLYLIDYYYPHYEYYHPIVEKVNWLKLNTDRYTYIDEKVIIFITSFSKGTVHGYTGLFFMLQYYFHHYQKLKNYKIGVYQKSQNGILEFIRHFFSDDQIIYLEDFKVYKIKQILFIPNKFHNYFYSQEFIENTYKFYREKIWKIMEIPTYSKIIILKTNHKNCKNRNIITSEGIIDYDLGIEYANRIKFKFISIDNYSEKEYLYLINSCEYMIISWGTSFFKNYIFVSEKCKKIIVLIPPGFMYQFKDYQNFFKIDKLPIKIKNADILYYPIQDLDLKTSWYHEYLINNLYQVDQNIFRVNNPFNSNDNQYPLISWDVLDKVKPYLHSEKKITCYDIYLEPIHYHLYEFTQNIEKIPSKFTNQEYLSFDLPEFILNLDVNNLSIESYSNLLEIFGYYYLIEVPLNLDRYKYYPHQNQETYQKLDYQIVFLYNTEIEKSENTLFSKLFRMINNFIPKVLVKLFYYHENYNYIQLIQNLIDKHNLSVGNLSLEERNLKFPEQNDKNKKMKNFENIINYNQGKIFINKIYKGIQVEKKKWFPSIKIEENTLSKKKICILITGLTYINNYQCRDESKLRIINYQLYLKNFQDYIYIYFKKYFNYDIDIYLVTNNSIMKNDILDKYQPKKYLFIDEEKKNNLGGKHILKKIQGLNMILEEIKKGEKYHHVLVTRFDIFFKKKLLPENLNFSEMNIYSILENSEVICDNFYLFPQSYLVKFTQLLKNVFDIFRNKKEYIVPNYLHYIKEYIEEDIPINFIKNEYVSVGKLDSYILNIKSPFENILFIISGNGSNFTRYYESLHTNIITNMTTRPEILIYLKNQKKISQSENDSRQEILEYMKSHDYYKIWDIMIDSQKKYDELNLAKFKYYWYLGNSYQEILKIEEEIERQYDYYMFLSPNLYFNQKIDTYKLSLEDPTLFYNSRIYDGENKYQEHMILIPRKYLKKYFNNTWEIFSKLNDFEDQKLEDIFISQIKDTNYQIYQGIDYSIKSE